MNSYLIELICVLTAYRSPNMGIGLQQVIGRSLGSKQETIVEEELSACTIRIDVDALVSRIG